MEEQIFPLIWYCFIGFCVVMYLVLDGFDLGVGSLIFSQKEDENRRILYNAIGPFWDGNEVWLIVIGGSALAGFPLFYASLFSSFYIPTMILLACIIFRAVSIEFRSKLEGKKWRSFWDFNFFFSSVLLSFTGGIFFANLLIGIPIDQNYEFVGSFSDFISPFSVAVGIVAISMFLMQGSIFLLFKTEGDLHNRMRRIAYRSSIVFLVLYIAISVFIYYAYPFVFDLVFHHRYLLTIPTIQFFAILLTIRLVARNRGGWAFIFSSICIAGLAVLYSLGTFPYLIRSSVPGVKGLTYMDAAVGTSTYWVIFIVALCGVPCIFGYGIWLYQLFKGKVRLHSGSY